MALAEARERFLFQMDIEPLHLHAGGTLDVEPAQTVLLVKIEGEDKPALVKVVRKKRARFEALFF